MLLTGRDKGGARAEKLARLADGSAALAVGTHALFQDDVAFRSLSLTVIDEQHRFGVSERARLQAKAQSAHLLAMSATPIPRTLELTLYGDLDISRIDEKPPGRTAGDPPASRCCRESTSAATQVVAAIWARRRRAGYQAYLDLSAGLGDPGTRRPRSAAEMRASRALTQALGMAVSD